MSENHLDFSGLLKKYGKNENIKKNKDQKKNIASKTAYAAKNRRENTRDFERNEKKQRERNDLNLEYTGYVGAPYNFVPISKETYDYKKNQKKQTMHNVLDKDLLSGCITYQIQAKTPILVDSGKKDRNGQGIGEFYRDASGNYAIPGSSIRGLVRGNAQVLSFAEVGEDIDDYHLMYRNVASGMDKNLYNKILGADSISIDNKNPKNKISVLKHIKAGYIAKRGKDYIIYRTKVDQINTELGAMNYYVASERAILEDYQQNLEHSKFQYLYSSNLVLQYTKDCKFKEQRNQKTGRKEYIPEEKRMFNGRLNGRYRPFYREISYEIYGERKVGAIGAPREYTKKGYLVSSGAMERKKVIYIIPEMDRKKDFITIPEKDIDSYKRDFEGKKTQIKYAEHFFELPQEEEEKPVFYIEYGGRLYFGFTPRLRLFYANSIKEGYQQKKTELDYCKALFGYSNKEKSFKSRLSFLDASVEQAQEMETCSVVLGSPKPTSYLDYIQSVEKPYQMGVTYNQEFRLRGIKQYWLKEQIVEQDIEENESKNKKIESKLKPLPAGTIFLGKVRFHNLTKDELGLLLWSLELNPESEQNIGKAKAYGYGRVKIVVEKLEIFDIEKAYQPNYIEENISDFLHPVYFVKQEEKEKLICCFKEEMKKWLGKKIEEMRSIKSFLLMKDARIIPDREKTRYMSIKNKEYQKRVQKRCPLPTIEKVIE